MSNITARQALAMVPERDAAECGVCAFVQRNALHR